MAISDEEVAQVRVATDVVALIGEHVALRRQGRRWVGLCPFHAEKTPSFSVNAQEGFYYCFGCHASGDAISFVRETEHLDFVETVRFLADRAGVAIHEQAGSDAEHQRRRELLAAVERAVAWYHDRLLTAPDAGRARDYLRSRGYDGETVRTFRLGWAPDDWDALSLSLHLTDRLLTESGLGFVNRRGRQQDAFRARVLFPICDPSGRPVAVGGRVLPSTGDGGRPEPKYKNSPETAIYAKRRILYALNWAKKDVVATGEVVVCEGYTDVIGCFQAGLPRAVATCGTALAEEHFRLLRNFGRRIVLAYDADQAGQSATARVYEWERRHDADVRVASMPAGSDPADLARTDPEGLRAAVSTAVPFLQFRVDRLLGTGDLSTAEGRARAAAAALAALAEHPDPLVRDQYVMALADRTRVPADLLRQRLEEALRHPTRPDEPGRRRPGGRREEEDGGDGRHGDGRRDGWGTGGRRGGAGGAGGGGPGAGRA
ncbi:MAG: DNA primase, partial [Acidimicrobiales bacterium]